MMNRIAESILVLVAVINLGWVALNVGSNAWVPVPAPSAKVVEGRVFVHFNWIHGGLTGYIPVITALLCVSAVVLWNVKRNAK